MDECSLSFSPSLTSSEFVAAQYSREHSQSSKTMSIPSVTFARPILGQRCTEERCHAISCVSFPIHVISLAMLLPLPD